MKKRPPLCGLLRLTQTMGQLFLLFGIISFLIITSLILSSKEDKFDYDGVFSPYSPSTYPNLSSFPSSEVKYYYNKEYKSVLLKQPAVKQLCNNVKWRENVYIDCYYNIMGAFNAINRLQVCIRWAMDAGVGLITPKFWKRVGIITLNDPSAGRHDIDFLLDSDFLWEALQENCPQLKVISRSEIKGDIIEVHSKYIVAFNNRFGIGDFNHHVDSLLPSSSSIPSSSPIIIMQHESLYGWKVINDPLSFQIGYRELFLFNPSIIDLSLSLLFKLPTDFIGIHLRAEEDWGRESTGMIILDKLLERRLEHYPIIYVACGDEKQLKKFMNMAGEKGMKIATKWSVANEEEKERMKEMAFDQKGLVDFIILNHSKYYYGVGESSFSFEVGLNRHLEYFGDINYSGLDDDQYLLGRIEPLFENVGVW